MQNQFAKLALPRSEIENVFSYVKLLFIMICWIDNTNLTTQNLKEEKTVNS